MSQFQTQQYSMPPFLLADSGAQLASGGGLGRHFAPLLWRAWPRGERAWPLMSALAPDSENTLINRVGPL